MREAEFKTVPMEHQLRGIDRLLGCTLKGRIGEWFDIGLGKTLTAIYGAYLLESRSALVVCPNSVIRTWKEQITEHTTLSYTVLQGGSLAARKFMLQYGGYDFYIINFEGLKSLWAEKREVSRGKNKGKNKYYPVKISEELSFDCLIIDESHHLADPYSLQTRIIFELAKKCPYVIELTGTPDNGKLKSLWSQGYALDHGKRLGYHFPRYISRYFRQIYKGSFPDWVPKKGSLNEVMTELSDVTVRVDRRDCADLPDLTEQVREVELTPEQKKYKKTISQNIRSDMRELGITTSVKNKTIKLLQVNGGFFLDGENPIRMKESPKLDAMLDIVEESSGKVIVFHSFVEEGRMIEEFLKKRKIKVSCLRGEVKNKDAEVEKFKNDASTKVLVAHPASGGIGQNFQFSNVIVFYSYAMLSPTRLAQAIGRIHRTGQKTACSVYYLVARHSADEPALLSILQNAEQAQAILDWLRDNQED